MVFYKREFLKMQKGNMKMADYLKAMKKLVDNLALAGHPVSLDDLVSQVLTGLDSVEYNPLVCQIAEKESISWIELQSRLLSYEKRLEQLNAGIATINLGQPMVNYANTRGSNNYGAHNKNQMQSQSQNQPGNVFANQGGGRTSGHNNRGGRFS